MTDEVMKIIVDAILALLGVLVTSGIPFLIGLLKEKLGEKKFYTIVRYADQAVNVAELLGAANGWDGAAKKAWVVNALSKLKVDPVALDLFIEDEVSTLKKYGGELVKNGKGVVPKSAVCVD